MSKKKKPKLGEGTLGAYARQGLAEVRGALYPTGNVAQPTDPGMWGNKTQGEIADERRGRTPSDSKEEDRESLREKVLGKYDSRVYEEREASRGGGDRGKEKPSMERD